MPWNSRRYWLSGSLSADAELFAALDDEEAEPPDLDGIGGIVGDLPCLTVHRDADLAAVQFEGSGRGRAVGQHDIVSRRRPEAVGAFVQPE